MSLYLCQIQETLPFLSTRQSMGPGRRIQARGGPRLVPPSYPTSRAGQGESRAFVRVTYVFNEQVEAKKAVE